ncbi:MAG: ribosome small subunit-dependent GTPase A [Bacteroidales bacterium]|nr:ribosome small subunit-dependent GTPase A [Bacteroidales bacterium]MCF8327218.1 ribosome small subunit-dependent GTPase A [Bacteroidales bacterium]
MQSDKQGIIIKSTGKWYLVQTTEGEKLYCALKGKFRIKGLKTTNPLAVGDNVIFHMQDEDTGVIKHIKPRSNYIIRKSTKLSSQAHIIASNIDQGLIVATLSYPRTSTGFIDRFLVTAAAYHIPVKIIFNKSDIYTEEENVQLKELTQTYKAIGYETLVTSAKTSDGLEQLQDYLDQKRSVIVGHSGVGKSALLNTLVPGMNLRIGDLSHVHLKGKHTTTFAEMHEIWKGSYVIDTPGIKEFGLIDMEKEEVHLFFPEMFKLNDQCRFYNCTHVHEPGCAVKKAVENGEIKRFRYKNYLNMLQGNEMNLNPWEQK